MEFSAQQIADFLNGEVIGDKDIKVNNFSKIEEGKPHTITFLANPKYTQYIYETEADIEMVKGRRCLSGYQSAAYSGSKCKTLENWYLSQSRYCGICRCGARCIRGSFCLYRRTL